MLPPQNLRTRLESLTTFPPMPELARRIIDLGPTPEVGELVAIVELDPGLSAQMMRQAASPFYGYRGKVESVRDAITRVLGIDRALHLAFGIAAGHGMLSPAEGPLGRKVIWVHAVYSAALMQSLASIVALGIEASPGLCYLSGLLHNVGFLLLGHLFPDDLDTLNKLVASEPGTPVINLERRLFQSDHAEIGTWLMRKWNMPREVITAVCCHHDPGYRGDHAPYANLALISDRVLQRLDLGDAGSQDLPVDMLAYLGLSEDDVMGALQVLLEVRSDLDSLARHLAAAA